MERDDFANMAWGMFNSTGQIGYYMLYKNLVEDEELEKREREDMFR